MLQRFYSHLAMRTQHYAVSNRHIAAINRQLVRPCTHGAIFCCAQRHSNSKNLFDLVKKRDCLEEIHSIFHIQEKIRKSCRAASKNNVKKLIFKQILRHFRNLETNDIFWKYNNFSTLTGCSLSIYFPYFPYFP